jgi:hypothetical protein
LYSRGVLCLSRGDVGKARTWMEKAIVSAASSDLPISPARGEVMLNVAKQSGKKGIKLAEWVLDKDIKELGGRDHQRVTEDLIVLAECRLEAGQYSQAKAALMDVVNGNEMPEVTMLLGDTCKLLRDVKSAEDKYMETIALLERSGNKTAEAHFKLANVLSPSERAVDEFAKALDLMRAGSGGGSAVFAERLEEAARVAKQVVGRKRQVSLWANEAIKVYRAVYGVADRRTDRAVEEWLEVMSPVEEAEDAD